MARPACLSRKATNPVPPISYHDCDISSRCVSSSFTITHTLTFFLIPILLVSFLMPYTILPMALLAPVAAQNTIGSNAAANAAAAAITNLENQTIGDALPTGNASSSQVPSSLGAAQETNSTFTGPVIKTIATLPPFTGARLCVPFNVLILPPPSDSTKMDPNKTVLHFTAEPAVINATLVLLSQSGVLSVSIASGFKSDYPINLTIIATDPSTLKFVQNFGSGNVVVGPGFNLRGIQIASTAVGGVYVYGLNNTGTTTVTTAGTATVLVNATSYGSQTIVAASGISQVFLSGPANSPKFVPPKLVTVDVSGISTVFVRGDASTKIVGTADNLAKVLYSSSSAPSAKLPKANAGATCSVQPRIQSLFGVNLFGDTCRKVSEAAQAPSVPSWTCGVIVDGTSNCLSGIDDSNSVPESFGFSPSGVGEPASVGESPEASGQPSNATSPTEAGTTETTPVQQSLASPLASPPIPPAASPSAPPSASAAGSASSPSITSSLLSGFPITSLLTPSGSITTGTLTTPGGSAYSSGTVSTGNSPAVTQTETSQGGSTPTITTTGVSPSVSPPPSITSPIPSSAAEPTAENNNTAAQSATVQGEEVEPTTPPATPSATPSPSTSLASAIAATGGKTGPITATSVSGVPTSTGGLAIVSIPCRFATVTPMVTLA